MKTGESDDIGDTEDRMEGIAIEANQKQHPAAPKSQILFLEHVAGDDLHRAGRDQLVAHHVVHHRKFCIGIKAYFLEVKFDAG